MDVLRAEFFPDPSLDRDSMESLQRDLAMSAVFEDDFGFDIAAIDIDAPVANPHDDQTPPVVADEPVVVGIDQAFTDDRAVSAAVAIQGGEIVEVSVGRAALELPYIPGLLAFREAPAIVDALENLSIDADLLVLDGSGRLHYRQAGIATHIGVMFDTPAIGVAKSLLCGTPVRSLDDPLPTGTRVPIKADVSVDTDPGTVIGYAYQSRQFSNPSRRHVNPLIISPGHRVSADTTVDIVSALSAGYKLPEPTRLADQVVDGYKD